VIFESKQSLKANKTQQNNSWTQAPAKSWGFPRLPLDTSRVIPKRTGHAIFRSILTKTENKSIKVAEHSFRARFC